jgi:hypothetical protein
MAKVGFGPKGMALNGKRRFWLDWNGLESSKSVLAELEWLEMEEIGIGLTGMAWNGGARYWPDWNGLEFQASLVWPKVTFSIPSHSIQAKPDFILSKPFHSGQNLLELTKKEEKTRASPDQLTTSSNLVKMLSESCQTTKTKNVSSTSVLFFGKVTTEEEEEEKN